ncbi:MAG TPA: PfkB family carbohydrate kinase [Herpetosiphonaceae bacterium]
MAQVIALGELLIDFVPTVSGVSLDEAPAFQKAAGGAPANVAVGLARLGASCAFLGKVGDDPFGHFLADTLRANGVETAGLRFDGEARTALAFVTLRADGEREFMFYRHPSADMRYRPDEVDASLIEGARIFHCGSVSLISEPARAATLHALDLARAAGLLVSYDPNLRLMLWPSAEAAHAAILEAWPLANVIKVSDEELRFLSGEDNLLRAGRALWTPELRLLLITRGAGGCTWLTANCAGGLPGLAVAAVDATGAGDSFMAAALAGLLERPALWEDVPALEQALRVANAAGALATTKRGAIPALPTREEIAALLGEG